MFSLVKLQLQACQCIKQEIAANVVMNETTASNHVSALKHGRCGHSSGKLLQNYSCVRQVSRRTRPWCQLESNVR